MNKNLLTQIYDLKIKQIKAKINFKEKDAKNYEKELNSIYKVLDLSEIKEIKEDLLVKYAQSKNLEKNVAKMNKQSARYINKTSCHEAKEFYELSTKSLAFNSLIQDFDALINKINNKELQF